MASASVTYDFAPNTTIVSSEVDTNFNDVVSFLNSEVIHRDASIAFTSTPSGPATDPTTDNQFVRKAYVDKRARLIGAADLGGSASGDVVMQAKSEIVSTNAAGEGSVSFPTAFNGLTSVVAVVQDSGRFLNVKSTSTSGFVVEVWNDPSGRAANVNVRINWIAVGWV